MVSGKCVFNMAQPPEKNQIIPCLWYSTAEQPKPADQMMAFLQKYDIPMLADEKKTHHILDHYVTIIPIEIPNTKPLKSRKNIMIDPDFRS